LYAAAYVLSTPIRKRRRRQIESGNRGVKTILGDVTFEGAAHVALEAGGSFAHFGGWRSGSGGM
jgi:hypothetical protein